MSQWLFIHTTRRSLHSFTPAKLNHRRPIRLTLAIATAITALLVTRTSLTPAAAESGLQVVYGRPSEGQITDATPQQEWDFAPNSKDRINIIVERTGDTLVPTVELHDDTGKVVAKADHDATYARASISNFMLPAPGRYSVVVARYNGQAGKTYGKYKLVVTLLGLGADGYSPTFVEAELQLGQQRDGTVSEARWRDTWAFRTLNTDPVTIIASRVRGTLVPSVELFDSNWKEVARGQLDESFTTTAIAEYLPTASSQYYVVISRIDGTNGGTTGDYRLMVVQGQQQ